MPYFLFTLTAVTILVITAYAVEQLCSTYSAEITARMAELDRLDTLAWQDYNS